jgi:hypothetical protein
MSNPSAKLLTLAHDVAFRLGVEAQIQATHERREASYALAFHELTLQQVKDLLHWLDYYVPTLDEQKVAKRGPMGDEFEGQPIPRRKAGAS